MHNPTLQRHTLSPHLSEPNLWAPNAPNSILMSSVRSLSQHRHTYTSPDIAQPCTLHLVPHRPGQVRTAAQRHDYLEYLLELSSERVRTLLQTHTYEVWRGKCW